MEIRFLLALSLIAIFGGVRTQNVVNPDLRRLCNAQSVCRDCIQASPMCSWCANETFPSTSPRCYPTNDPEVMCPGMEQNPMGEAMNANNVALEGITQISPSSIDVSVRPGQPVTFPLQVRPARNFPIDLYLLMDLSFSMNDDLNNLKRLGAQLAESIVGISNNFTIGFGSFVDKRLGPYVNLRPEIQNNPCLGNSGFPDGCVATYSYRHVVSLTPNQTFFNERVQAQSISGNQDAPEGGFDGFLQSIVCTEVIGWRGLSRKLLLYITDAGFHFANDGKLGGVILPHDGLCKVATPSRPGMEVDYNDWDVYDYPSIGQIAELLRQNDIIPIFAAEANARPIYDELVRELGDGAFSGTLAADSSNVVTLVRELYDAISQRIIFDPRPIPGVSFSITPTNCPGTVTADGICTGVEIGDIATFDVSVSLTECNAENSGQTVEVPIRIVGFGTFTVRLTAICGCPCEESPMTNSPLCNGQGNLTCGICDCNPDRLGDLCQCDAAGIGATGLMCPLGPTDIQCTRSDRGTCVCGECICRTNAQGEPEFYGPACECDDSRCGRVNGLLCSGRGTCSCNGCQCNVEPTTNMPYINGDARACECTPATNCIDPRNNTATCNGRGTCGCDGTCQCNAPYSGTYCERCSGSSECTENCDINLVCAQCALDVIEPYAMTLTQEEFFSDGLLSREGIPAGSTFNLTGDTYQLMLPPANEFCDRVTEATRCPPIVIINGTFEANYMIDGVDSVRCEGQVGVCTFRYFVAADESDMIAPNANPFLDVHVEFLRSCPEAVASTAPWIIAIAIIIPLLVLGLLALILLKVLLLIYDAVEVKRFEEELARTKYSKNLNPLYQPPIEEIDNPAYGK